MQVRRLYSIGSVPLLQLDRYPALSRQVHVARDRIAERVLEVVLHGGNDSTVRSCDLTLDVPTA